ncbi:MAG: hypothetical protein IPL04_00205 [Chitinophagaceae bacterium]|nr:hypothetical protein [Chitinophagaceae bacterium]
MVGNDKTKHGCITSAGYTYSFIKKDCIKVFEQEIKLLSVKDETSFQKQTCIIFSKNNKKAEVFLDSIEAPYLQELERKETIPGKTEILL